MESRPGKTRRHLPTSPFPPVEPRPPLQDYAPADRVTHDRFGLGRVESTEPGPWVTVRFAAGCVRVANDRRLSKL